MQSGYTPKISDIDIDMKRAISERDKLLQFEILKKNFKNKLEQMNQPVSITDIVVLQEKSTPSSENNKGEFNYTNCYNDEINHLIRIRDTIELLTTIAAQIHKKENFTSDGKIKSAHANHITRLAIHEFSLYTHDPLTLAEFELLLDWIQKIIPKMPENLHLVFSSIAVVDKDNKNEFSNNTIYAVCGKKNELHIVTKIATAKNDPMYSKFQKITVDISGVEYTSGNLCLAPPFSGMKNFNGIIKCKTVGDAEFYTVIEICLDHFRGQGKLGYEKIIQSICSNKVNEFIPNQLSQLVLSNSVKIICRNSLVTNVVRIDPDKSYSKNSLAEKYTFDNNYLENLGFDMDEEYPNTKSKQLNNTTLAIINPPFGPDLTIQIFPKYQLLQPNKIFLWQIVNHNEAIINQYKPLITNCNLFSAFSNKLRHEINRKILSQFNDELSTVEAKLQVFKTNLLRTCPVSTRNLFKSYNPIEKQISLIKDCKQEVNKLELNDLNFETKAFDLLKNLEIESRKYEFADDTENTIESLSNQMHCQLKIL